MTNYNKAKTSTVKAKEKSSNSKTYIREQKVIAKISFFSLLFDRVRNIAYRWLTANGLTLFSRGGDNIAFCTNVLGRYEVQTCKILEQFAKDGNSDFLIDIGANIGISSCQSGKYFGYVIMFEPNPLCVGILQTNSALALPINSYKINPYGLGKRSEMAKLRIPKNNWGGAYLVSPENSYSPETLYKKDNLESNDGDNYLIRDVEVRNAEDVFSSLFENLRQNGRFSGSVKIDVEGLELEILFALAKTLPDDMSVSIVFEYWENNFPGIRLLDKFEGRANLYALRRFPIRESRSLAQYTKLMGHFYLRFILEEWHEGHRNCDLVLKVSTK